MENSNQIVLWENNSKPAIPKKVKNISEMILYGIQLQKKDKKQIALAFENEAYEMVATYTWTKAISSLKNQLGQMGVSFIAEMLDRPDINEYSNLQQSISEFEAIRLAEELGVISKTAAFRLRKSMDTVNHFNQLELEEEPENEMSEDEAKTIVRSCIEGILGYNRIEAAIDFKNFRKELEESTLSDDNPYIIKLISSPYFFYRAVIRVLMSIIKTSSGAQLENSLANANTIVPKIWNDLQHPEKWQIGRTYSEMFSDGQTKAANGLKKVLLKVKGFDFVPEDLRSSSFIKVANEILQAHENMNNFYNEPAPVRTLSKMGSVIPSPAFPIVMTSVLCVKLGNYYGVSNAAQTPANEVFKRTTDDRWAYFFKHCFKTNDRVLYKLSDGTIAHRWLKFFDKELLDHLLTEINDKDIQTLLRATSSRKITPLTRVARKMYEAIGYSNE